MVSLPPVSLTGDESDISMNRCPPGHTPKVAVDDSRDKHFCSRKVSVSGRESSRWLRTDRTVGLSIFLVDPVMRGYVAPRGETTLLGVLQERTSSWRYATP